MNGKILSVFVTNLGKYTEGGCYVALVDTPVEYAREDLQELYSGGMAA